MEVWVNGSKQAILPLLWVSVNRLKGLKLVPGVSEKLQVLQQMESVSPVSHHGEFKKTTNAVVFAAFTSILNILFKKKTTEGQDTSQPALCA